MLSTESDIRERFDMRHNASNGSMPDNILSAWAYDAQTRKIIGRAVRGGSLVEIRNALHPAIAETLHSELLHRDSWVRENEPNTSNIQFSRHVLYCGSRGGSTRCLPVLTALHDNLASDLNFWKQFTLCELRRWSSSVDGAHATEYRLGDFISPHSDVMNNRALAFVLSLAKDWDAHRGGTLWCFNGRSVEVVPKFRRCCSSSPLHVRSISSAQLSVGPNANRSATSAMCCRGRRMAAESAHYHHAALRYPAGLKRRTRCILNAWKRSSRWKLRTTSFTWTVRRRRATHDLELTFRFK